MKRVRAAIRGSPWFILSPANCGGLIEAAFVYCGAHVVVDTFPRELRGPH